MKLLMIIGAMIGFLTGTCFGLAARSDWPSVFWRASAAAFVSCFLMRWWGRVWLNSWKASLASKLAKLEAARQEANSTNISKA